MTYTTPQSSERVSSYGTRMRLFSKFWLPQGSRQPNMLVQYRVPAAVMGIVCGSEYQCIGVYLDPLPFL